VTPLRVAEVIGTTSGGTGSHVAMLASGIQEQGLTATVLGPPAARSQFPPGAVAFIAVDIGDRPRPVADAAAIVSLRRRLVQAAPDVVHAHGLRAGALAAVALGCCARRPPALLVTVHNAAPSGRPAAAVYRLLELIVARRAAAVLCASGDLAARMRGLGAREVGQAVVAVPEPRPPSDEAVSKARADIGAAGRPVLLAAGRLAPQKGFGVLLDAASAWQARKPPPVVAIAGAGPLAAELSARATAARLEVVFLGQRDDIPALLAAADVVVVPSWWEARALIVQEALRAGKPIVATRVGGIPDLTGEDGAVLVPPGDPGLLAAALLSVLDDHALAARLGASALARAQALPSEADAVTAAVSAYQRLAARSAGRAGRGAAGDAIRNPQRAKGDVHDTR
jgi:glycosyltransferase involved in cell wall biosynthesis